MVENKKQFIKVFIKIIEEYLIKEMPDNVVTEKEFIERAWDVCCIKLAHIKNGYKGG